MRKMLFFCLVACFCLTACGGGGGGGGSSGGGEVIVGPFDESSYTVRSEGFYTMSRTASGITFNVIDVSKLGLDSGYTVAFANTDFTSKGDDLVYASKKVPGMTASGAVADVTHSVYLGDGDLEFAQFGVWGAEVKVGGVSTAAGSAPMISGYASKKSAFTSAATGGATFTGSSVAVVTAANTGNLTWLEGSAKLFVNFGNLSAAKLDLSYDDFYDFSIAGINVASSSGAFNKTGATLSLGKENNNNTGYTLTKPGLDILEGQFYGDNAGTPTEAVGRFWILEGDVGVAGAFGVDR